MLIQPTDTQDDYYHDAQIPTNFIQSAVDTIMHTYHDRGKYEDTEHHVTMLIVKIIRAVAEEDHRYLKSAFLERDCELLNMDGEIIREGIYNKLKTMKKNRVGKNIRYSVSHNITESQRKEQAENE